MIKEFQGHGEVMNFRISEGKGGLKHGRRVQRSLIFQPALQASCSQDVLARRSFLLARKFSMFYSAPVN